MAFKKRPTVSLLLAMLFYASVFPWSARGACFSYYDQCVGDVTGDNTSVISGINSITGGGTNPSISGFTLGASGYTDNVRANDFITRGPWVDVRAYGATDNTGTTDYSAEILAAINAALPGQVVLIPPGVWQFAVTLPNKAVTIFAYGASISSPSSTAVFTHTNHGALFSIYGAKFTGAGNAYKANMTPSESMYKEFEIRDCTFSLNSSIYALYLYGPRTGYVSNSHFTSGNGIYLQSTCLTFIKDSTFNGTGYTQNAIIYDGDGLSTSCGIGIMNTEILGYDNGLIIRYADWANISGSTIDYNNNSVRLESTTSASITGGSYIGSAGDNTAIWIGKGVGAVGTPDYSNHINITDSNILCHIESGTACDAITITDGSSGVRIINNTIHFYTRYGIFVDNALYLNISGNHFAERPGFGLFSIFNNGASDSTWNINGNIFVNEGKALSGMAYATLKDNIRFTTEWSGQKITDNTVTSWYVPHNLSVTPDSVLISASVNHPVWVDNVTSTGFTLNTDATYLPFSIYWHASKVKGN